MTAERDYRDFLNDMVLACHSIIRFVDGMSLDDYLADEKTRYAVMRAYEILGEAVRHLPETMKMANADIPWATMTAVRNRSHTDISASMTRFCSLQSIKTLSHYCPSFEAPAREYGVGQ